jgi:hypothetical protein
MNYLEVLGTTLLGALASLPIILAWLAGIIISVRMLRRGGGRAEKLLLIGCSLMLAGQIIRPFLTALALWLTAENMRMTVATMGLTLSLPRGILDMAGIVCLILAFWFRWRAGVAETQ